jgi:hypothetical protein
MKAIEQIINYLNARGVLSVEQLAYLERHGLWDRHAEHRDQQPDETPFFGARDILPEEDWDALEGPTARDRKRRAARKPKELQHNAHVLEAEAIDARLRGCFDNWRDALEGLVQVGRRLTPCASWQAAAVAVRNAHPETVYDVVREGLRARDPSLRVLWDAVVLDEYRHLLELPEVRGPVAVAYRAVLNVPEYRQLGKYAWLLKSAAVGSVFNLRLAQRELLLAGERLFSDQPDVLATALVRDYHALAYWSFVLLYTARRLRKPDDPSVPAGSEHLPSRQPPDRAGWLRVWSHTAVMEPIRILPLLVRFNEKQAAGAGADPPPGLLICPRRWDPKGWEPPPEPEQPQGGS